MQIISPIHLTGKQEFITRKRTEGPESDLVDKFLHQIEPMFAESGFRFSVFIEPYIDIGFPDIVGVVWDEDSLKNWSLSRTKINRIDIRILNHISMGGIRKRISDLNEELGYTEKVMEKSLQRLLDANLVTTDSSFYIPKSINDIFVPKKIIAIEAKINNWKEAFKQAHLNQWFASESYVLFPGETARRDLLAYSEESEVGLLLGKNNKFINFNHSKERNIPTSYGSWLISEWLGNFFYRSQT